MIIPIKQPQIRSDKRRKLICNLLFEKYFANPRLAACSIVLVNGIG